MDPEFKKLFDDLKIAAVWTIARSAERLVFKNGRWVPFPGELQQQAWDLIYLIKNKNNFC